MTRVALIVGITGSFGGALAQALAEHGWKVRALHREPARAQAKVSTGVVNEWVAGDAMAEDAVVRAAAGAEVIVHAVNPPNYRNWRGLALPMLRNSITAAAANDARVVFPGNVYNYGPDSWADIKEDSPQHPVTRKGAIRVEMEALLRTTPVRSLIVRAGDFFGGRGASSWFDLAMVKAGQPLRRVVYPGAVEVGHAWAYLPDLAEAVARLLAREAALERVALFNFAGHYLPRGIEMAQSIRRAAGDQTLPVRRLPWPLLRLAAPFSETLRELMEMRYLWQEDVRLNGGKLQRFLGEVPHTPLDVAVRDALSELGCLRGEALAA